MKPYIQLIIHSNIFHTIKNNRLILNEFNLPNDMGNNLNELSKDGVTKLIFNNEEYVFWNKAKVVLPFVYEFLKTNFPDHLLLPELNHIDFVVLEENLPVEVQSTIILGSKKKEKKHLAHSYFEQMIEKQIKQNIERYGKCWFFFDTEKFRYLKSETSNSIRLNLEWFVKYVRDGLLKVFIVSHDGQIKDVSYEDLKFLSNFENSIAGGNKIKIISQVLYGYGYTTTEIRKFRNEKRQNESKKAFVTWLREKEHPQRKKTLGYVIRSMSELNYIDNFLFRKRTDWKRVYSPAPYLGILKKENNLWSLEDRFDIIQYFPGYLENKLFWDEIKNKKYRTDDFLNIIYNG